MLRSLPHPSESLRIACTTIPGSQDAEARTRSRSCSTWRRLTQLRVLPDTMGMKHFHVWVRSGRVFTMRPLLYESRHTATSVARRLRLNGADRLVLACEACPETRPSRRRPPRWGAIARRLAERFSRMSWALVTRGTRRLGFRYGGSRTARSSTAERAGSTSRPTSLERTPAEGRRAQAPARRGGRETRPHHQPALAAVGLGYPGAGPRRTTPTDASPRRSLGTARRVPDTASSRMPRT